MHVKNKHPLDLSGLTTLTKLIAGKSPVSRLPTSLVECEVSLRSDTNFSPLTSLTSLCVSMKPGIRVTFPAGLKQLSINEGKLGDSNIGDVALEVFQTGWCHRIARDELEKLPKTLKKISGSYEPESLQEHFREMFPLLEFPEK